MLAAIMAKLVSAPIIGALLKPIIDGLLNGYRAKLDSVNNHETLVVDLKKRELDVEAQAQAAQAQMVIAEQGNWFTRSIRPLMAMPFVLFIWKIIVWDKILASWTGGHTDPLDPKMWGVFMVVVGAYMGGRSIEIGAIKVADAIKSRKL